MTTDSKQQALTFLKANAVGVLATISDAGGPRARTVYYSANDDFEIFFMTLRSTRKAEDLAHEHRAAFVVSDSQAPQTLQIEGVVTELTGTAVIDSTVKDLLATFNAHGPHFAPLTHMHADVVSYYKISPTWIRFGNFTEGQGEERVFATISV